MDLKDVLADGALNHDDWSLSAPRFGEQLQLEVMGWSGRDNSEVKFYVLKCSICSQDPELFGEGYFKVTKSNVVNLKQSPCGCSGKYLWTKEQYHIRCSRKANELGHTFLGFDGEWKKISTKIKMLCEKHGEWSSTVNNFLNIGSDCRRCRIEARPSPDADIISSFFVSGMFHPDTKFWRSDRLNRAGGKPYWLMLCPECQEIGEAEAGNFRRGSRPCGCSNNRQTESYINLVKDGETVLAIKFGVTNNVNLRLHSQKSSCIFDIENHSVYKFPDYNSCRQAERHCKLELECRVLSREEMPDGYTETTWAYNLDRVMEIYERNGGVLCE